MIAMIKIALILVIVTTHIAAQSRWTLIDSLQVGRHRFCALPISKTEILVIGGWGYSTNHFMGTPLQDCEIIDIRTWTVRSAAPLNVGRAEFVALLTPDSNVVVISGITESVQFSGGAGMNTPTVEYYDRQTNQWRIIGNLLVPRRQHTAAWLNDHEILVVGGRLGNLSTTASAEIFDIRTGQSRATTDYPNPMTDLVSGISSSGKVCIFGGRTGGPNSYRTDTVYFFDDASAQWRYHSQIGTALKAPALIKLFDGRLCATGGEIRENPYVTSPEVSIESADRFTTQSILLSGRKWHGMAQWSNDTILIAGGYSNSNTALSICEWVDIRTYTASLAPQLNVARGYPILISMQHPVNRRPVIVAISGLDTTNRNTPTIEVLMDGCITEPLTITGPTTLCDGDTVTLSASDGFAQYLWSTGQNSPRIWVSKPGTYSVTATDSAGCSTSDSITISLIPSVRIRLLSNPPRSAPIATLHCDTIEVTNPSSDTLWLDDIVLARNVEWSLPQHQRPLRLLPGQRHLLVVCWYATAHGSYRDTLCIVTPCGSACLPLLLQTRPTQWRAISRCGVAVETPIEVADQGQSLLLQTPATVRVRDCLGRILLECPSDGQTASIPTASLLPGLYILDRDGSPALLLVR
jgi:hypothetical protein